MKKLELKHLAPYLPYGLKIMVKNKKANISYMSRKSLAFCFMNGFGEVEKVSWENIHTKNIKPILRPLSDLTSDEFHDELCMAQYGSLFVDGFDNELNEISCFDGETIRGNMYSYDFFEKLFELHFDIFGLIEAGLAVDINTLKK